MSPSPSQSPAPGAVASPKSIPVTTGFVGQIVKNGVKTPSTSACSIRSKGWRFTATSSLFRSDTPPEQNEFDSAGLYP